MDKVSIPNNFPRTFTNVSSTEENLTTINALRIDCKDISYSNFVNAIPLQNTWNSAIKRGFDISISLLLIICILSWLIPLLAIFIKLDSRGPIFFLQKRNKNKGHFFTCIKFRSMFVNKDADILAASENDKRITRLGRYLRKYHIDELPQLINVLTGDMSIIGPRPHMISENIMYESLLQNYDYRYNVKPGITGLAQSMGNFGSTNDLEKVKERVYLDIFYINKWSLGMDLKILFRTSLQLMGVTDLLNK